MNRNLTLLTCAALAVTATVMWAVLSDTGDDETAKGPATETQRGLSDFEPEQAGTGQEASEQTEAGRRAVETPRVRRDDEDDPPPDPNNNNNNNNNNANPRLRLPGALPPLPKSRRAPERARNAAPLDPEHALGQAKNALGQLEGQMRDNLKEVQAAGTDREALDEAVSSFHRTSGEAMKRLATARDALPKEQRRALDEVMQRRLRPLTSEIMSALSEQMRRANEAKEANGANEAKDRAPTPGDHPRQRAPH